MYAGYRSVTLSHHRVDDTAPRLPIVARRENRAAWRARPTWPEASVAPGGKCGSTSDNWEFLVHGTRSVARPGVPVQIFATRARAGWMVRYLASTSHRHRRCISLYARACEGDSLPRVVDISLDSTMLGDAGSIRGAVMCALGVVTASDFGGSRWLRGGGLRLLGGGRDHDLADCLARRRRREGLIGCL